MRPTPFVIPAAPGHPEPALGHPEPSLRHPEAAAEGSRFTDQHAL